MSDDSKVSDLESQISGLQESSATKDELAQVEQSISRFSDLLDKIPTKDDVDKLQQKVDSESKLADARYSTSGSASDTDKLSQIEFDLAQARQELNVAKKQLADLWPIKPTADSAVAPEVVEGVNIMITDHLQDGTKKRWFYAWVEVEKTGTGYDGWTTKSGGLSGTTTVNPIYNRIEDRNRAVGLCGNGVDIVNLTGSFAIQPIPSFVPMLAWPVEGPSGTEYWIEYENGVDGACP